MLPKREVIAEDLRRHISDGVYVEGDRLPTEEELQAGYGVSRGTVRDAVDLLEAQGLVERRPGRTGGTFVRKHVLVDIYAWRDDQPMSTNSEADLYFRTIAEQGHQPSQDFSTRVESLPPEYADLLAVDAGHPAFVRRCLRYVDGVPHSIQDSWYPSWLCDRVPALRSPENIPQGTTRLLADADFEQVAALGITTGHMPTPAEATLLRIPPVGDTVMRNILTGYTTNGPLRISVASLAGSRTRLISAHGDISVIERFRR